MRERTDAGYRSQSSPPHVPNSSRVTTTLTPHSERHAGSLPFMGVKALARAKENLPVPPPQE